MGQIGAIWVKSGEFSLSLSLSLSDSLSLSLSESLFSLSLSALSPLPLSPAPLPSPQWNSSDFTCHWSGSGRIEVSGGSSANFWTYWGSRSVAKSREVTLTEIVFGIPPAPHGSLPGPLGPKSPKSLRKSLLAPSGPGVQKVSETVSKESPESQNSLF